MCHPMPNLFFCFLTLLLARESLSMVLALLPLQQDLAAMFLKGLKATEIL